MNFKILSKQEQISTKWSGGTTTQLAIFPEIATYRELNFLFRISTAKTETEESEFTNLPGISRTIMVLDGNLLLNHQGHYSKTLQKFDTDIFDGSWKTSSKGKVTDFNLMTAGRATGKLFSRIIPANQTLTESLFETFDFVGFYLVCGEIEVGYKGRKFRLGKDDFMILNHEKDFSQFAVKAHEYSELIIPLVKLHGGE